MEWILKLEVLNRAPINLILIMYLKLFNFQKRHLEMKKQGSNISMLQNQTCTY